MAVVQCRLREIMADRHMTVRQLHRLSHVGRDTISALRTNDWQRVSRDALGRICGALGLPLADLFEAYDADIWYAIRLHREVTIHLGSNSFPHPAGPARSPGRRTVLEQQFIGSWDMRAFFVLGDHLRKVAPGVDVRFQEHVAGLDPGPDPGSSDAASRVFAGGNHIVLGSPLANQFAEELVCRAYGMPPYTPHMREAFPFGFVWDSRRSVASSFGWQGLGNAFGIASTRTGKLVARRTLVPQGEGEDCALIVVHRVWQAPAHRRMGRHDERVVIAILGHSGPGTLAGAIAATDPGYRAALYPSRHGQPLMRVVAARYERPASPSGSNPRRDNRRVTAVRLVDEGEEEEGGAHCRTTGATTAPRGRKSGPWRRESPAAQAAAQKERQAGKSAAATSLAGAPVVTGSGEDEPCASGSGKIAGVSSPSGPQCGSSGRPAGASPSVAENVALPSPRSSPSPKTARCGRRSSPRPDLP